MKPLSAFVLLLLVLGLVLAWAVLWGPLRDAPIITGRPTTRAQEAPPPPEKAAPEKATRGPGSRRANAASAAAEGATAASLEQSPAAATSSSTPPKPVKFPTSAEIPLGMQGSRIVAAFGEPIARTIGMDQGGQIEIFIYRRGDPNTATFIHLRNSRVISASTTLY